jgi:hypothetical protein
MRLVFGALLYRDESTVHILVRMLATRGVWLGQSPLLNIRILFRSGH